VPSTTTIVALSRDHLWRSLDWATMTIPGSQLPVRSLRMEIVMSSSSTTLPTPQGPGSVSGAPNLPAGFTDIFTSRYIDAGGLRQHVVIGGNGPRCCWCTAGQRPGTPGGL
jgi:hypothetical protein